MRNVWKCIVLCLFSILLSQVNLQEITYAAENQVTENQSTESQSTEVVVDLEEHIVKSGGFIGNSSLSEFDLSQMGTMGLQTDAKQLLENTMEEINTTCDLSGCNLSQDAVSKLIIDIANENPRYFYVEYGNIAYTMENEYVTSVRFTYTGDETQVQASQDAYEAAVSEILSGVSSDWTDLEKALYLNDYLTENCEYDLTYSRYSAYDIIVDKTGVCQAYAEAYKDLAERLGMSCEMVTSWSLNHAWNLLKINGSYYHVDATWNDPVPDRMGRSRHQYFLKSSQYFQSYEGGHYEGEMDWQVSGGVSLSEAANTCYDDYFWNNVDTAFKCFNGTWYSIAWERYSGTAIESYTCDGVNFVKGEDLTSFNHIWYVWDNQYSYWVGYFGGFGQNGNYLYYASPTAIHAYNIMNGEVVDVYQLSATEQSKGNIYGIRVSPNGTIEYLLSTGPQEDGTICKTNAIKVVRYKIKFDGNGNTSGSMPTLTCYSDVETKLPKNKFARRGYKFTGWNRAKDGSSKAYKDAATVENLTKKDNNVVTLYAQWEKIKYNLTYELNGGKNNTKNPSYYYVTTSTIELKNPTKKGYTFKGWYSDKNFKNKVTKIEKGSVGSKKLYAKWQKTKYLITYELNKGKNHADNPDRYYINTATIKLATPKRTGYTFKGWYSDKEFKNQVTEIKKGSTGNKTLYARWSAHKYDVAFKGNGATSGSMKTLEKCIYNKTYTLGANKFKRTGYQFTGWNTKADGSGKEIKNKAEIKNLTSTNGKTVTLYAQWKKVKYTITYNLNKGTNHKDNPDRYYVTTSTIKLEKPKRTGCIFKGWYTDPEFKTPITEIKKGSTGNIVLYARWKKVK